MHQYLAIEGRCSGPEADAVIFPFVQADAVVCLICKTVPGCHRRKMQIMRVYFVLRLLRIQCQLSLAATGAPAIQPVEILAVMIIVSPGFLEFKIPVFQHLRIQPAVGRIIDILKKQAEHPRLYGRFHIFTDFYLIHSVSPFLPLYFPA